MIVSFNIPEDQHRKLKALAVNRSMSAVIRELINTLTDPSKPVEYEEYDLPDTPFTKVMNTLKCSKCRNLGYACPAHQPERLGY